MAPGYAHLPQDDENASDSNAAPAAATAGLEAPAISPVAAANPWSRLIFAWQTKLFKDGAEKRLEPEDMAAWPLRPYDNCERVADLVEAAWRKEEQSAGAGQASLARALFAAFGPQIIKGGLPKVSYIMAALVNVFAIQSLLHGLAAPPENTEEIWWEGLLFLAPLMGLCQFGMSCSQHHLWNRNQAGIGMNARTGVTTLIFSKCMRLRAQELSGSTKKDPVNLMTSDTERIVNVFAWIHWFWASIVEIILCLALSAREISWAALGGFAVMVIMAPIQARLGKAIADIRRAVVVETDHRVTMMNEVLSGIKLIKLFNYEAAFLERVSLLRDRETHNLLKAAAIKSANSALAFVLPLLVCLASFSLYEAMGCELTGACGYNRPCAHQYVGKYQSCMI